jgi:hypothetical protein
MAWVSRYIAGYFFSKIGFWLVFTQNKNIKK